VLSSRISTGNKINSDSIIADFQIENPGSRDFDSLRALVRLRPIGQQEGASIGVVASYHFLLPGLYVICSRIFETFAGWAECERRRCTYFVAVALNRRIANTRSF
jgi:hypothetical protein